MPSKIGEPLGQRLDHVDGRYGVARIPKTKPKTADVAGVEVMQFVVAHRRRHDRDARPRGPSCASASSMHVLSTPKFFDCTSTARVVPMRRCTAA
jgi:hypothetical protein